jgi:ribosomal protein S13
MYKRDKLKNPEYKLIMNENNKIEISLDNLIESECIQNINESIKRYHTIEAYITDLFEKDNTTKYKKRVKGIRNKVPVAEFDIQEKPNVPVAEFDIQEKPKVPVAEFDIQEKPKNLAKNIVAEFDIQEEKEKEDLGNPIEEIEIVPVKKRGRTKKLKVNVNPHGKTKKTIVSNI